MTEFQNIFDKAIKSHNTNIELNKIKQSENLSEKIKKEQCIEEKRKNNVQVYNYETDCYSQELLELIKKFEFVIEAYDKFVDIDYDDYSPTLEIYYCKKNNWKFEIHNFSDVDITEGIFALKNLKNFLTEESVNSFYCDIGCRNTGESRLLELLEFFEYNSLSDYVKYKYEHYIELPNLLRSAGYDVKENDYSFGLNKSTGYLEIEKNLFIRVYIAWMDDIKFVITNNNKWDINSSNHSIRTRAEKSYFFNYNSKNSFHELCKCIEAFKDEQAGKIGYFEQGNYYSNSNIIDLFNKYKKSDKDAWNHHLIRIDYDDYWDCRGYDEENSLIINKYKGLEVFVKTEVTFNDAAQWTIGEYSNKSLIIFEYDKRKNTEKCRLKIDNYIYKDSFITQNYDEVTEEYNIIYDDKNLIESIELYGTFLELYEVLEAYIVTMFKIHNIKINEKETI